MVPVQEAFAQTSCWTKPVRGSSASVARCAYVARAAMGKEAFRARQQLAPRRAGCAAGGRYRAVRRVSGAYRRAESDSSGGWAGDWATRSHGTWGFTFKQSAG